MEIKGQRVTIHTTSQADLIDLIGLWNDGRVMKWVGFPDGLGYDQEAAKAWFARVEKDAHRHHFVVHAKGIGFCGELYYAVNQGESRASLDIKFTPAAQGQGLAADALQFLINHVFETEEGVSWVWTEPSEVNTAARRLYRRCGLKPEVRPVDLGRGESYWALSREDWSRTERL